MATQYDPGMNWPETFWYAATSYFEPSNEEDLKSFVEWNTNPIKVIGTRRSYNDIADTNGTHISMR